MRIRCGRIVTDKTHPRDYDRIYGDSSRATSSLNNSHDPTGPFNYFNRWRHPTYRRGTLHTLQSVSKTVASAAIGVAVTHGESPDLDTPILRHWDTPPSRTSTIAIGALLSATCGR